MNLSEKIQQLKHIQDQEAAIRSEVLDNIKNLVDVGQNPAVKPIGDGNTRCFTINSSELLGKPWSPGYHDWNTQAARLVALLEKKPVELWKDLIAEWSKGAPTDKSQIVVDKVQLNTDFLQKVLEQM